MTRPDRQPRAPARHRARKRFGQHFLEPSWVDKVIDVISAGRDDLVLEIGPGQGALTVRLAEVVSRLVAVEIDRDLAARLGSLVPPNTRIVQADFLTLCEANLRDVVSDIDATPLRVVGNLPYNVATPIIFHLVDLHEHGLPIRDAVLMLQREVANRVLAEPGSREYGVLSVLLQHVAECERLLALPPGAFRPIPEVHSTLIRLRFHAPDPPVASLVGMRTLVRGVFTQRRKTLSRALAIALRLSPLRVSTALARAGIAGERRPETLSLAEFAALSNALDATP